MTDGPGIVFDKEEDVFMCPFDEEEEIAGKEEVGDDHAASQLQELLESHVAYETELILGDVLRDWVLLHMTSIRYVGRGRVELGLGDDLVFVGKRITPIATYPRLDLGDGFTSC